MTTLWSGRFDAAPDAAAFEFGASFRFDRRLFEDDVTGSLAWARALGARRRAAARRGRSDRNHARTTSSSAAARIPQFVAGADEDVHSFVERQLVERLGDAGRRLHTGRSRNEQVSLDLRLYLRRRIPLLQRGVAGVVAALAGAGGVGRRRADAVVHALPPGAAGAGRALLPRARRRRCGAITSGSAARASEADALPLGSGAIAGTSYADRRRRARRATSASRASSPTASTPRRIATSRRRSSTPAR